MRFAPLLWFPAAFLVCTSATSQAQSTPDPTDSQTSTTRPLGPQTKVNVTAVQGVDQTVAPNPMTSLSGHQMMTLAGAGHMSSYLVTNLAPGVIANTADPYGLSFTRSINVRGRSDFFLDRTFNGLPVAGLVGGTTDLFDLEDVQSEQVYSGPLQANQGFGASNNGGVIDQTILRPEDAKGFYLEQSAGAYDFWRSFARYGTGELSTGTALFVSGSTSQSNNWKGPGGASRNNATGALSQKLGDRADLNLNYVYNEQNADNYAYLSYAQAQDLSQNYNLSYLSSLKGVPAADFNQFFKANTQKFIDTAVLATVNYRFTQSSVLSFHPYYWDDHGHSNILLGQNIRGWQQSKDNYGFVLNQEQQFSPSLHLSAGFWFQSLSADPPVVQQKNFSVNAQGQLNFLSWAILGAFNHQHYMSPYGQLTYTKGKTIYAAGLRYQIETSPRSTYFLTKNLPNVSYAQVLALHPQADPNAFTAAKTFYNPLPNAGVQQRITSYLDLDLSYSRKIGGRVDFGPQATTFFSAESAFLAHGENLQDLFYLLKPETDDQIDLVPALQWHNLSVLPDMYFYKAHNKQVLVYDPTIKESYYQSNVSTTGYGVDLSANYQLTHSLAAFVSGDAARESYDQNIPILDGSKAGSMQIAGKQIPNDPKETLKGMLTYHDHGITADFVERYLSSRFGLPTDTQRISPYAIADMNVSYGFGQDTHLQGLVAGISGQNLFGRKYIGVLSVNEDSLSSINYYAGASRTIAGSLTYSFGGGSGH